MPIRPSVLAALLVLTPVAAADPPEPKTWQEAYNHIQDRRDEARKLWKAEGATGDDLAKARDTLEAAHRYFHTPAVTRLARGNLYLKGRLHDSAFDLAQVYARLGDVPKCVEQLETMLAQESYRGWSDSLAKDPWFKDVVADPAGKAVLRKMRALERLWDSPVWAGKSADTLTEDERIAGLSRFWSEAKNGFAYFDRVPDLDWDRAFLDALPRVRAAKTTEEYYRELMRLCARLNDGHTNVYPPKELRERFYSRPPVRTELVEGRVLITRVAAEASKLGLAVGQEVVSVDGVAVKTYAEERVAPFACSSTPQDRTARTYTYDLLTGPKDAPVKLEVAGADGKASTLTVPRAGPADAERPPAYEFRLLDGNVGLLTLRGFEDRKAVSERFLNEFEEIAKTDALVIDLRDNGGGDSDVGYAVLACLTDKPFATGRSKAREYQPVMRAQGGATHWWPLEQAERFAADGKRHYAKPVALLVGPRTFSAAEDFAVAFDAMRRGPLVGEPTAGSTGQPLAFALPGGGSARVCVKRDRYPDGKEFVGVGVRPTVAAAATVASVRAGKDPVLEAGVAAVRKAAVKTGK